MGCAVLLKFTGSVATLILLIVPLNSNSQIQPNIVKRRNLLRTYDEEVLIKLYDMITVSLKVSTHPLDA